MNAKEIRDLRLVNFAFYNLISSHPLLMWAKNVRRIQIRSYENEKQVRKEWAQLRLDNLISRFCCPNFHFVKTDLDVPWAMEFFQSSVRHQIKILKLTKCSITMQALLHVLACCGRKLEHLEIVEFPKYKSSPAEDIHQARSPPNLSLPSLVTVILHEQSSLTTRNENKAISSDFYNLLHIIVSGSQCMEKIVLAELSAKTCHRITKLLGSVYPDKLQSVEMLEILCRIDRDLSAKQQYEWLRQFGWIQLPNLRKLAIKFDKDGPQLNQDVIRQMAESIGVFIEGSRETLECIELVNCPVSNNVFKGGIDSFPSLRHVNTRDSFVTKLQQKPNNQESPPVYEYFNGNVNRRRRRESSQNCLAQDEENTNDSYSKASSVIQQRCSAEAMRSRRVEVYKLMCTALVVFSVTHMLLNCAFGCGSHIVTKLEAILIAFIALWITKRDEISEMWSTAFPE